MAWARIAPRSTGPRPQPMPMNQPVHYRPELKSQKTARSAVWIEPTTFQSAATDNDKGWRLYRIGHFKNRYLIYNTNSGKRLSNTCYFAMPVAVNVVIVSQDLSPARRQEESGTEEQVHLREAAHGEGEAAHADTARNSETHPARDWTEFQQVLQGAETTSDLSFIYSG